MGGKPSFVSSHHHTKALLKLLLKSWDAKIQLFVFSQVNLKGSEMKKPHFLPIKCFKAWGGDF